MDITLKEYASNVKNFISDIEKYINDINEYGFSGSNPLEYQKIYEMLESATKTNKKFESIKDVGKSLEDKFKIFSLVIECRSNISGVVAALKKCEFSESKQFTFSSSSGKQFSHEIYIELQGRLQDLIYTETLLMPDYEVYTLALGFGKGLKFDEMENVHEIYKKYNSAGKGPFVIELYTQIIQAMIDELTQMSDGSKAINKQIEYIETLKTQALAHETNMLRVNNKAKVNAVQKLIARNNLIPSGDAKPLNELFGYGKISSFQTLADKLSSDSEFDINLCVITKITPSPMEHKLEPLINKKYLIEKNLFQSSDMGINQKVFARTNTIVRLANSKGKDSIEIYKPKKTAKIAKTTKTHKICIIETLDGTNYRFLHPWDLKSENVVSTNFYLPDTWAKLLPEPDTTPSMRMFYYNDILNKTILENLHEPYIKMDFMTRTEVAKSNTKWANIRNNIIRDLIVKYKPVEKPGAGTLSLFAKKEFLGDTISLIAKKLANTDKISNPIVLREISVSYVKDLESVNKRLERELKNAYEGRSPKDTFTSLMDGVLSKFINSKGNISNTIEYKVKLVNKVLKIESDESEEKQSY